MDDSPTEFELNDQIPQISARKIRKLAKVYQITFNPNLTGKEKQQNIFETWVQNNVKRREIIQALRYIDEDETADKYSANILSFEERTKESASLFKSVQEENAPVETCVMQCMPLGPPRVGKTCLKKRLMQENPIQAADSSFSPSTPIVEEKLSILTPSMLTLKAETTKWKHIPIESEVLHLIHKFKNSPHSTILYALASLDKQSQHLLQIALPISFILYLIYYTEVEMNNLLLNTFVFFSLASALVSWMGKKPFAISWSFTFAVLMFCIFLIQFSSFIVLYYEKALTYMRHWIFLLLLEIVGRVIFRCFVKHFFQVGYLIFYIILQIIFYVWLFSANELEDELFFSGVFILLTSPLIYSLQTYRLTFQGYFLTFLLAICYQLLFHHCSGFFIILPVLFKTFLAVYGIYDTYKVYRKRMWYFACIVINLLHLYYQCITYLLILMDVYTAMIFITADVQKRTINSLDYDETSASISIVKKAMEKSNISSVIRDSSTIEDESLKIYFTDSGGQPEFQEVLPALLSGPTVFFLVFDLSKGLDAKYHVEYVDESHTTFRPYETQFTVMDALLQCLATISCIGEFSKTRNQKNIGIMPKVFFVGTHKDLVTTDIILKMEKQLELAVKNTSWYKKDVIQHASNDSLIFSVDNFDSTDSLFNQIRQTIEKLAQSSNYKVQIPAPWLGLELRLRTLKESVISISKCKEIASQCSLSTGENLNKALWFLHNRLGSIRHYQQIPELHDIVITKPQMLFTIVTDLLVGTFPLASGKANAKFREKGCFTRDELNQVGNLHKTGLSVTQVIALLCHLHILAPLKIGNAVADYNYFLPCALSHAPKPDSTQLQSKGTAAPPLLIGFKCGYTPKGVFSGLISYMLQHKHSGLKWSLDEDCIFRDQATFIIGATGYCLMIKYLPKYLHLELHQPKNSTENRTIYKRVLSSIKKGLNTVQQRLNYTCDTDPSFGFYCDHDSCINDDPHPAFLFKDVNGILTCSKHSSNTLYLTSEQRKWFPFTVSGLSIGIFIKIKNALTGIYSVLTKPIKWFCTCCPILILISLVGVLASLLIVFAPDEVDIYELKSNFSHVKNVQRNHYHSLCQFEKQQLAGSARGIGILGCELENKFQSLKPVNIIRPIRANQPQYLFPDQLSQSCAMLIIVASFDNCHPKPCQDPMHEIQNGFIRYLELCSLDSHIHEDHDICWPILHHLTSGDPEITFAPTDINLHNTKITFSGPLLEKIYFMFKASLYTIFDKSCTKHVINRIESKGLTIENFLAIIKFIMYTKPELAPVLVLKNIDEAFSKNNPANEAIGNILYHISREASSPRWLVPIIATAKDLQWFNKTKHNGTLLKNYFPHHMLLLYDLYMLSRYNQILNDLIDNHVPPLSMVPLASSITN